MQEIDNMDLVWYLELTDYEDEIGQSPEEKRVCIDQVM